MVDLKDINKDLRAVPRGKSVLDVKMPKIYFEEVKFSRNAGKINIFTGGVPIKEKWVYIIHWQTNPTLEGEIFIDSKNVLWEMNKDVRGKRNKPTKKNSKLCGPFYRLRRELLIGTFYFYLSPIPLGQKAIDKLIDFIKKEEGGQVVGIEDDFKKAKWFAEELSTHQNPQYKQWIVWRDQLRETDKYGKHATVRAAFNFDQDGNLVKEITSKTKFPWKHTVVLQDPQAWLEDIHREVVCPHIQAYQEYRGDRARLQMRFIANTVMNQIYQGDEKGLRKHLLGTEDNSAEILLKRLNWKEHLSSFLPKGSGQRFYTIYNMGLVKIREERLRRRKFPIPIRGPLLPDLNQYDPRKSSSNTAQQILDIDSVFEMGFVEYVNVVIEQLCDYINSSRHRVLCAEHTYASQDAHGARGARICLDAADEEAAQNAVSGMVHWAVVCSNLNEHERGRELIKEITRSANKARSEDDPHFFSLPRALAYATLSGESSSHFSQSMEYFLVHRAWKSVNAFADIFWAGVLDESFLEKPLDKIAKWMDKWFSKILSPSESTLQALHEKSLQALHERSLPVLHEKSFKEYLNVGFDINTPPEVRKQKFDQLNEVFEKSYREKEMLLKTGKIDLLEHIEIQKRMKLYKGKVLWFENSKALYNSFRMVVELYALVERIKRENNDESLQDIRTVVFIFEAANSVAVSIAELMQRRGVEVPSSLRIAANPRLGRALGIGGAVLDFLIAAEGLSNAQTPEEFTGQSCIYLGAGTLMFASVSMATKGGIVKVAKSPLGMLLALASIAIWAIGEWLVRGSSSEMGKFVQKSFLGKSDYEYAEYKIAQHYEDLMRFLMSYSVTLTFEGEIIINPGLYFIGDKFQVDLKIGDPETIKTGTCNLTIEELPIVTVEENSQKPLRIQFKSSKWDGTRLSEIRLGVNIDNIVKYKNSEWDIELWVQLHSSQLGASPLKEDTLRIPRNKFHMQIKHTYNPTPGSMEPTYKYEPDFSVTELIFDEM